MFCHGWLDTDFATDIRINLILEWHSNTQILLRMARHGFCHGYTD
ncbi:hypothetical protein [Okeania sp. SIO3I5]|nr:hypothetical protein [Okeania sp. SIO3I5]